MPTGKSEAGTAGAASGTPLIIVESPSKARTLERYLGGRFTVRASLGSIRDLPKSDMGIDEAHEFDQTYVVIPGKEKTIRDLKSLAKKSSQVLLGTDPDREGEAISWHLAEELKLKDPLRVEFEEITRTGVEKALQSPRPIDTALVNAQVARRVIDRLVGYKVSPVLWRKVKPSISAGRVQSVAVRLVCEREAEIDAFNSREYWTVEVDLKHANREPAFTARLLTRRPASGDPDENTEEATEEGGGRPELADEAAATSVVERLRSASYEVATVERRERSSNPRAPYETSTLQQDASTRLGFNPRRAMQVAQQLYEGVDLGPEGSAGLITYMRTDDTRISDEAVGATRAFVDSRFGADYSAPRAWGKKGAKSKAKPAAVEAQSAHEAIRPTDVTRTPESVSPFLSPEQLRLYTLVWRRFVASQMAPARYDTTRVDISAADLPLRATGSIRRFDGFERVWEREASDDSGIPDLAAGDALSMLDIRSEQHFTQPPPRFSEASLIKELEERGIGRPSTYAPTIETIVKRGYVKLLERRLHPTPLGKAVNTFLVSNFGKLLEYDFTANMESDLDLIEKGTAWVPFMQNFNDQLDGWLSSAREADPVRPAAERTGEACPRCGEGELVKREGRYGEFVGCSRYPECDYIKDREERQAPQETGRTCPDCGKPLVERQSRRGPFVGCSGYPGCKFIEKSEGDTTGRPQPETLDRNCPRCNRVLVRRQSRRGPFVGCSGYPDCKFTEKSAPGSGEVAPSPPLELLDETCEACGKPLAMRQGRFGQFKSCSDYPACKGPGKTPARTPGKASPTARKARKKPAPAR
ncbi:MAG: type I DNA topoisomerase [Candidatus Dormibacteria bacterium]